MTGEVFDRTGKSATDIEQERLLGTIARSEQERLLFLLDLIELSRRLRGIGQATYDKTTNMSLFQGEILALFRALHGEGVRYLLVGGFAVNVHGHSRATGDIDLWLENTIENRVRLVNAGKSIGIAGANQLQTMDWVPGWSGFRLSNGFEVEIMAYIKGFSEEAFSACYEHARIIRLEDIPVPVLSLDDLIAAKAALNRVKDQEDLRYLKAIRRLREE